MGSYRTSICRKRLVEEACLKSDRLMDEDGVEYDELGATCETSAAP